MIDIIYKVDQETLTWAFGLVQRSLKSMYETATDFGGWNPELKLEEMSDINGRYLIAVDMETHQRVGYLYFQFVEEESLNDPLPVLVIFIHVNISMSMK